MSQAKAEHVLQADKEVISSPLAVLKSLVTQVVQRSHSSLCQWGAESLPKKFSCSQKWQLLSCPKRRKSHISLEVRRMGPHIHRLRTHAMNVFSVCSVKRKTIKLFAPDKKFVEVLASADPGIRQRKLVSTGAVKAECPVVR